MATMSLPSAYKIHSALIDGVVPGQEWQMYSDVDPKSEYADERIPAARQDQLTKATKDLMSLDSASLRWNESADRHTISDLLSSSSSSGAAAAGSGLTLNTSSLRHHQPSPASHPSPLHRFPSPHSPPSIFNGSFSQLHRPPLTVAPNHTLDNRSTTSQHSLSSISSDPSPQPPTPPSTSTKRPSELIITSDGASSSSSRTQSCSKKRRTSPSSASDRPNAGPSSGSGLTTGSGKPALLSPSQKKANHIQSEQKRRANIRRGYDALCETVPALREAIRAEEEEQAALAAASLDVNGNPKNKSRKKGKGKKGVSDAEKVDGRAGPKSENVVLQKTIDYINDLLDERTQLLNRMKRARSYLSPGHPALEPLSADQPQLWEREWSGGLGIMDDLEAEGDSEDEDD